MRGHGETIDTVVELARRAGASCTFKSTESGHLAAVLGFNRRGETFAESAATTNRLLAELWERGEAHIDDGTLTCGDFRVERPSSPTFADDFSISDPRVLDLLPQFELETSDPLFDGLMVAASRGSLANLARDAAPATGNAICRCEPPRICGRDKRCTSATSP